MYWDCPRCATENSLDATRCWRCGFQYFPGGKRPTRPSASSRPLGESLDKQRQEIRDDIRKGLEDAMERTRASLDRLAGGTPQHAREATPREEAPEPTDGESKDKPRDRG